jgi:hypothetical protein
MIKLIKSQWCYIVAMLTMAVCAAITFDISYVLIEVLIGLLWVHSHSSWEKDYAAGFNDGAKYIIKRAKEIENEQNN